LFRVYPNPTSGVFTLEMKGDNNPEKANVEIFNIYGEKVFASEISGQGKHELSLEEKSQGIYVIRVIAGGKAETARIVRQ
jgi:hypothetical protein